MLINGYNYHFRYDVGAYLTLTELHITMPKTKGEEARWVARMAVIMSKEYEDAIKVLDDPDYKVNYLTMELVRTMKVEELTQLSKEVDDAYREGTQITVPVKSGSRGKKQKGEATALS